MDDPLLNYSLNTFQRYATARIQDQAIPNYYDGMLPTQRAYVQSMQDVGAFYKNKPIKATKAVAHVSANYRPVGETYDVLVNMSQAWKVSILLTAPQGNWGPIDNGVAAAQRYTEIKLSPFCEGVVLPDLPKRMEAEKTPHTVVPTAKCEFGHLWEEEYLPVRLPMILLNGSNGIAVSMAQTYQPLSIHAFLPAFIKYVKEKTYDPTVEDTTQFDYSALYMGYPVNPVIAQTQEEVTQVFRKGSGGSILTMGRFHFEYKGKKLDSISEAGQKVDTIVFTSIPPQKVLNDIGNAFNLERIENPEMNFSGMKNETDTKNIRLMFKLKTIHTTCTEELDFQIGLLYDKCGLKSNCKINMTALKDSFPIKYNIDSILNDWTRERHQILIRVSAEQAERLTRQINRLNLLRMAKAFKSSVMDVVTKSDKEDEIHTDLSTIFERHLERFSLNQYTEEDTKEISALSLRQLSKLEDESQLKRLQDLLDRRAEYVSLMESEEARKTHLATELEQILHNLDAWGVKKYKNEYDPSLARYANRASRPQPPKEYVAESLSIVPTPNVVVYTKKGFTYLVKNNSVKSAELSIPLLTGDRIEQAFFSFSEKTPFLFADGTVHFIDVPVGTMMTPLKLANLSNKKVNSANLDITRYAIPICVDYTCSDSTKSSNFHFIALDGMNQIKRVEAQEISTARSKLTFKNTPTAIWLIDKSAKMVTILNHVISLDPYAPVSAKATGRLPKAPVFGTTHTIKTHNRGYYLSHNGDAIWKETAPAPTTKNIFASEPKKAPEPSTVKKTSPFL